MRSIIVGTAGHIDHGKTALVKALTGIDADRLEEEKRRGITIDLGFAHMDLTDPHGDKLHLGFVDVPGHERFVRNMLAGVGGIDLVLLIIAADESIKPQTREHFDILQLLGVRRGITVLTKSDAVDAETLDVVRLEVEEFLRGTFLEPPRAPIVAVSSLTGAGLANLKQAILAIADDVELRDSRAIARLPIDRVFTMKGFGTVVTGTLVSGTIRREDELEVFPSGHKVRARLVQVHGQMADEAVAGQRTALNLAGASTEDLSRGMTIAPPSTFSSTRTVDVQLRMLPSAPRPLKNRSRVHFHSNTMETIAEVIYRENVLTEPGPGNALRSQNARMAGAGQLSPGAVAFARIKLSEKALLLPGDRFIIRQFSPVMTIGGGIVLDAAPVTRKVETGPGIEILAGTDREAILQQRIARHYHDGVGMSDLIAETGWREDAIGSELAKAIREREIIRIGDVFVIWSAWQALKKQIVPALEAFHRKNPLVGGISMEELRVQGDAGDLIFEAIMQELVQEKKIEVAGELVRLPGRGVVMKDEESESKARIEEAFATTGLKVPALQEVLAGLKIDKARAQKIVTLLLREKALVKVSEELIFHRTALQQLRRQIADHKKKAPRIDVGQFKELTGVSRKYAIPLLEYLDRQRVTRRVGDTREIL